MDIGCLFRLLSACVLAVSEQCRIAVADFFVSILFLDPEVPVGTKCIVV